MEFIQEYLPMLLQGSGETLYMTAMSTVLAYAFGLPLGVLVILTRKDGLAPSPKLNAVLEWIINIGRSIPFLILMIALFPVTRLIVGKAYGPNAAVVALVIGAIPFVARMVEGSLEEIDHGVIEASQTMGASNWEIITKVYLPESLPSLVRGLSISTITLIGYSSMGGAVGAGGLGDIAIRYGYHRYEYTVMIVTILLLILIVQIIQCAFNALAKKIDKRIIK
ncbi:MAG: ABC transporter permease [Oscillospiraceae bacterium]|nr:ABC transporter permease [Oscillospiraceae bacterium]